MLQGTTVVKNQTGLHARPAAQLVKLCKNFQSEITITGDNDIVCNAKSMFSVLKGCLKQGTAVQITVDGPDETQALEQVIAYINALEE